MEPLQQRQPKPQRAWARASKQFHAANAIQLSEDWLGRFAELLAFRQRKGTFAAPPETDPRPGDGSNTSASSTPRTSCPSRRARGWPVVDSSSPNH